MDSDTDRRFMTMALALAEQGRGSVSPNPMVGAVVVRDGEIVGQGYHHEAGGPHAEVFAIHEAGDRARGATLYVTLEPCCHHGKTPPCTDLILKSGIARVVTAMTDDNPLVCGGGCSCLEDNNVIVDIGILERESRRLNETYLKYITTRTPFVTLKLATTLDGFIADSGGKSKWITGPGTRKHVHQWRAWSDAIMVGVGTVLADDPSLTVRDAEGKDPLRIIVDSSLRTPPDAKALADGNVLIAISNGADPDRIAHYRNRGTDVVAVEDDDGRVSLSALVKMLGKREVTSLFCEGGSLLAGSLLRQRLVDKIIFTVAPAVLGDGIHALSDTGIGSLDDAVRLSDVETETIDGDIIVTGYPRYSGV